MPSKATSAPWTRTSKTFGAKSNMTPATHALSLPSTGSATSSSVRKTIGGSKPRMRSLRARLSVAFIAVAILTTVLSATFATYQARRTFRQYVERREIPAVTAPGGRIAPPQQQPEPREQRRPPLGARELLFQSRIRDGIWAGTGVAALLGVLLALGLAHRMVRPVADLTSAARVIARGGTPPPVPVRGEDEI